MLVKVECSHYVLWKSRTVETSVVQQIQTPLVRRAAWLAVSVAAALTMGFASTVGQSGLQQTNANLCELWRSFSLPVSRTCEFQYLLPIVWGVAVCVVLSWALVELCRFLRVIAAWEIRVVTYTVLSIFFVSGAAVSVGFLVSEYRRPALQSPSQANDGAKTPQKVAIAPPPEASKPAANVSDDRAVIDLDDDAEAHLKNIQTAGTGTFLKQRGKSKIVIENGSATFADAKFPLAPLTEEARALTNDQVRKNLQAFLDELATFEKTFEAIRANDSARKAWDEDFRSRYVPQGRTLESIIVGRTGPVELPLSDENDMQRMQLVQSIRLGRSSLGHGKPIGIEPATNVANYLRFLSERLLP